MNHVVFINLLESSGNNHFLNSITIQVMLSQPIPALLAASVATIVSKSSLTISTTLSFPFLLLNLEVTKSHDS